jgi:hypothetical protein
MTDKIVNETESSNITPSSISVDQTEPINWEAHDNPYIRDVYTKFEQSGVQPETINAKLSVLSTLYRGYLMHCNSDLVDGTVKELSEGEDAILTKEEVAPFVDLRARLMETQPDGPAIVEAILLSLSSPESRLSTIDLLSGHLSKEQKDLLMKRYQLEQVGCASQDAK